MLFPLAEYLYATLANVIITLIAMLGIVMLLCTSCTNVFQWCIQFCISMAVGSLTGDALLHLIPMVGDFNICKVEAKGIIFIEYISHHQTWSLVKL